VLAVVGRPTFEGSTSDSAVQTALQSSRPACGVSSEGQPCSLLPFPHCKLLHLPLPHRQAVVSHPQGASDRVEDRLRPGATSIANSSSPHAGLIAIVHHFSRLHDTASLLPHPYISTYAILVPAPVLHSHTIAHTCTHARTHALHTPTPFPCDLHGRIRCSEKARAIQIHKRRASSLWPASRPHATANLSPSGRLDHLASGFSPPSL
jgi:hypothetical protein